MKNKYKKIFLITIDALRKDFVNEENAPFLTGLAKKGISFENCFTTGPYTSPSFCSIMGGVYPLQYDSYIPLPAETETVNGILKREGYYTIGIHSNPYLTESFGYGKGFNQFEEDLEKKEGGFEGSGIKGQLIKFIKRVPVIKKILSKIYTSIFPPDAPYVKAEKINEQVLKILKDLKKEKVFCWIHYMDVHYPYLPKKVSKKKLRLNWIVREKALNGNAKIDDEDVKGLKDLYRLEIKQLDYKFKKFYQSIPERYKKDSLFIITADHGEEFLEHGMFKHGNLPYEELMRVPLIIFGNDIDKKTIDKQVSMIDLPATILNLVNVETPPIYKGKDLFKEKRKFVLCQKLIKRKDTNWSTWEYILKDKEFDPNDFIKVNCYRDKRHKLIYSEKGEELYDLTKDPKEREGLNINKNRKLVKKLKKKLKEETKNEFE